MAHISENLNIFKNNEKVITYYLIKKINNIINIKNEINKDIQQRKILEQIEISYRNIKNNARRIR